MTRQGGWPPSGFGGRLQQLREQAGLTQAELAERAGCFALTVSKLERGAQEPAWPLVLALARALGVTSEAFVLPAGEPPAPPRSRPRGRPRKAGGVSEAAPGGEKRGRVSGGEGRPRKAAGGAREGPEGGRVAGKPAGAKQGGRDQGRKQKGKV
jgi:putative transcriptional regulator